MKVRNIVQYKSAKEVIKIIDKELKSIEDKKVKIALTGGKSWLSLYRILLKKNIFKKNYDYFLTDERCTKSKNLQNYHLLNKTFNSKLKIKKFYSSNDVAKNLKSYQNILPKRLDVVFVSLGLDGHVLSWFPNDLKWKSSQKVSFIIEKSIKIKKRLTLNKNFVNKSKIVFLLIKKNKYDIYNYSKNKKNFPVNHLKINYALIEN